MKVLSVETCMSLDAMKIEQLKETLIFMTEKIIHNSRGSLESAFNVRYISKFSYNLSRSFLTVRRSSLNFIAM